MLNPQNIDHGSPADAHDADMDLPAMPEPAQLEVLPEPTPPSTIPPQEPQPPPTTDTANYSTVGYGPSTAPTSTHYNNANDAYFVYLTRDRQQLSSHRRSEHYDDRLPHRNGRSTWPPLNAPQFRYHKESLRPSRIRGKQWDDICFSYEVDITDEDMSFFAREDVTPQEIQEHLSFITTDAKRQAEVRISQLNAEDRRRFQEAKDKELDQWISHAIFEVVNRAGIPTSRIMPMRWVLVWKTLNEGNETSVKAKARLVVKGFTDPDLTTLRAEAPTLSKASRHMLLQLGASSKFTFEVGDVKTAFLQGDKAERGRNVFLEPIAEIKHRFNLTDQQILKLVGSAYGLRTAPRNWYQRVKRDLLGQGWKMHSLDNCVFLLYDRNELIGLCGVYVNDFLIAGRDNDPRWQEAKKKLVNLYS